MVPASHGRILVEEWQQTVSAQRRLQNRVAQRMFRERKARKAQTPEDRILDLPVDPYHETTPGHYPPPAQQENREFNYPLDDSSIAEYNQIIAALSSEAPSANIGNTEGHQMTQLHSSNWYSPMGMGSGMMDIYAQSSSIPPPTSHVNVHSLGGLMGVNHARVWPPQEHSQEQDQHQAYFTPTQSNVSGANSPRTTIEASQGSTSFSKQHHSGSRPQSAHITTSLQHRPSTGSSGRTSVEDPNLEPLDPLLHVAIRSRSREVIRVLFRRGVVNIDDRDAGRRTALHLAAELGDESLIGLLLGQGADSQLQDSRGRLAVYYAVENGHHEIVELLLDA
ncbi:hypothetical protein T440DRAFT_484218 [Plenodomus tracheiphilus IPT5]|uniref:Uncharacterized protein n=1 Tax=Plenodomus tracheiphilus IPT5 TaxID=1408161 RepID=A0A6A7AQB9_9PLEO|nr:hypothetical protein T440DRAFT_484218 [Plenodomus tracheiphilus IPT5]